MDLSRKLVCHRDPKSFCKICFDLASTVAKRKLVCHRDPKSFCKICFDFAHRSDQQLQSAPVYFCSYRRHPQRLIVSRLRSW